MTRQIEAIREVTLKTQYRWNFACAELSQKPRDEVQPVGKENQ